MTAHDILMLALMLLGAHWLADYPLQGQFLSDAKVKGPLRFYHLVAHAGIHGAAVSLVTGNVWESSIEYLYSRNMIDMAQKMAGGKFRMYWESAGGKGASAIDYGREHVDGGSAIDPIPDMRADAGYQLKECQRILGIRGFSIMEMVAGQGVMIADLAKARNERDAYMFMLKDGLDLLAKLWGYKVQAPPARR